MLTIERQDLILSLLKKQEVVTVKQFCEAANASESTIRRDLTELEKKQYIKRVHGGASLLKKTREEPTILEKSTRHQQEKSMIAQRAASFVEQGDTVYLDAGTSTMELIPFLENKEVVVVTNGIPHVQLLTERGIETYVISGKAKKGTAALIGTKAVDAIKEFHFDKCFLGINGIHLEQGLTTPDPEEASVKRTAIAQSQASYILADPSKFGEVAFANVAQLSEVSIITTNGISQEQLREIRKQSTLEVVEI
ncbi:DeoR/GlpR family DNA-binding transcription regulator [Gracilibacillus caseinilyticus]|uniref:DeoR/GlpR family DNA-binding transcription regulator n=1 Tax=Gracilibacillus caseinilyticus TaxID=2932256 RepID=A0ABY4F198_9BACI|nr:DeoR/GlpR family DNA-binding transcription regulator [Gracilibacillus caseinilyticus]UOQ49947.1 DeoR/GlpR family DNA-binding transcription regulator [Gracilibacillus caseinilyticus]